MQTQTTSPTTTMNETFSREEAQGLYERAQVLLQEAEDRARYALTSYEDALAWQSDQQDQYTVITAEKAAMVAKRDAIEDHLKVAYSQIIKGMIAAADRYVLFILVDAQTQLDVAMTGLRTASQEVILARREVRLAFRRLQRLQAAEEAENC